VPPFVDRQVGNLNIISNYDANKTFRLIVQEVYDSVIALDKSNHIDVLKKRHFMFQVQEGVPFLKLSPFLFCPKFKMCHIQYDSKALWEILRKSDINGLPSFENLKAKGSPWTMNRLLQKFLYK